MAADGAPKVSKVVDLASRRVERVKTLAQAAAQHDNSSENAFERLKACVAAELLNQDSSGVAEAALAGLEGQPGWRALKGALQESRQVFQYEDRTVVAVVVPVGVRYRSPKKDAVVVEEGNADSMASLAAVVKRVAKAKAVTFDAHLYRAGQLLGANVREMRDHLLALEAKKVGKKSLTAPHKVRSGPEPDWEMVYFLGAATFERGGERRMRLPEVEQTLKGQGCHAEWAVDQADPVAWTEGVETEAECQGYYTMHRGIQIGEDRLRTLKLDSMVANMEQGATGVLFRYTIDERRERIRLLVESGVEWAEYLWPTYGEEGDSAFKHALKKVIEDRVADVRDVQVLSNVQYSEMAMRKGIVW